MLNILFICTGNICRSPMAEGVLKKILRDKHLHNQVAVCSAGTLEMQDAPASENSVKACQTEFQVDISNHKSQVISKDLLSHADIVLCMAKTHSETIDWAFPDYSYKCDLLKGYAGIQSVNLDVTDPIGGALEEYIQICHEISELLDKSMGKLLAEIELNNA